jgi:uncharacterized membrane protein
MNDGSEVPPDPPESTTEGAWEPVNRPETELPASSGQPFLPPAVTQASFPPGMPASASPPPGSFPPPGAQSFTGDYTGPQSTPPPGYQGVPPPSGGAPPPGQYPPQGSYQPPYGQGASLRPTTAAMLAYLTFIPAIIFLLVEPYRRDPLVRFHALQELLLCAAMLAGDLVFGHLGHTGRFINFLYHAVLFVGWLVAIIKAAGGERYHLPVLGELAENLSRTL